MVARVSDRDAEPPPICDPSAVSHPYRAPARADLGRMVSEHQTTKRWSEVVLGVALGAGPFVIILVLGVVAATSEGKLREELPGIGIVAGVLVLLIAGLVGGTAMMRRAFGMTFLVHEFGFVVRTLGKTHEIPWSRLESLKIIPPDTFGSAADAGAVLYADGQRFRLPHDLSKLLPLVEQIDEELERRVLPRLISAYEAGENVRFGDDVRLGSEGVTYAHRHVAWKRVFRLVVTPTLVDLLDIGGKRLLEIDKHDLPNADLFVQLAKRAIEERGGCH
jgi:hypothetical protein